MSEALERIAFVTGKLAEPALRRAVAEASASRPFEPIVAVLPISVAALMTPPWVATHLRLASPVDRVILPGHCRGDLAAVARVASAQVETGPVDLRDLPAWLSGAASADPDRRPEGYGAYRLEILAEVNGAPRLSREELLAQAAAYRRDGADVIDLGCDPGSIWRGLSDAVRALRDGGFRVSVDTVEPEEMALGAQAGAELILSVTSKTVEPARDLGCALVAMPDEPSDLESLEATAAKLRDWNVPHRLDPILEPIGFGFAASLGRYLEIRRRLPDAAMLMGVGNLTELTDVDSAGVNVLLAGFCEELSIGSVLTTQVIPWARTSVRELDLARRLMHYAVSRKTLPKHLEPGLLLLRDPKVREHGPAALEELAKSLTDPSVRLFAERGLIHAMSSALNARDADPFALFEKMGIGDPSHAFYLGFEMHKALTALTLGKEYVQDQPLRWGFLSREEASRHEAKHRRRKPGEKRP